MVKKKEHYQPLAIGNISTVSMEEWAEHWREHGSGWRDPRPDNPCYLKRAYGGSSISIIMGVSPYTTRLQYAHQKMGVEPLFKYKINEDSKELGHIYETAIALKYHYYRRKQGCKNLYMFVEGNVVDTDGNWQIDANGDKVKNPISMYMYRDGRKNSDGTFKYPWALANCDGFLKEGNLDGGLEIKTTSSRNIQAIEEWKAGIVPIYYLYQLVWYMLILNLQFFDICCSWGQGMDDMAVIRVWRDYDLEKKVIDAVSEFDEYVEQGIEPDVSSEKSDLLIQYYYELYGPVKEHLKDEPFIELPEKFRSSIARAISLDDEISKKEKELKTLKAKMADVYAELYPVFKNASYGQFRLDDTQVVGITLKTPMKRAMLDTEKFKKDYPQLYSQFQTFDCTGFAASSPENARLKKLYMLPQEPDIDNPSKLPSFSLKMLNRPLKN